MLYLKLADPHIQTDEASPRTNISLPLSHRFILHTSTFMAKQENVNEKLRI